MIVNDRLVVMGYDGLNSDIQTICPTCGKAWRFKVPCDPEEFVERFNQMLNPDIHIQDVFPDIDGKAREGILTGICDECFPNQSESLQGNELF